MQDKEEISTLREREEALLHRKEYNKHDMKETEDKILELQAEMGRLQMENAELRKKIHTEEPYEKIYKERLQLMDEHGLKISRIKELESHQKSLLESIDDHLSRKTLLEGENKALKAEKVELELRERSLKTESENIKKQTSDLEKEKCKFEQEVEKLRSELDCVKESNSCLEKEIKEAKQQNMAFIEELRKQLHEYKTKCEALMLESEALKSENESLFRANEAKKNEITDIQNDVSLKNKDLQLEKLRYDKLKREWDEEMNRTEFVLVSKDRRKRKNKIEPLIEENDSEDDHVVSVIEAANAEKQKLKQRETELERRVSELQTDKEQLFRSGTSLFAENKALQNKYDSVIEERSTLLQVEAALKRKVREQEKEISDLKKIVDDLHNHNLTLRSKTERDNETHAYVVRMGNETIERLEREKSALYRRLKYLEKENNEIESRVIDLEHQSRQLTEYSRKYDDETADIEEKQISVNAASCKKKSLIGTNYSNTNARITVRTALIPTETTKSRLHSANETTGYREPYRLSSYRAVTSPEYSKNTKTFHCSEPRQPSFGPASVRSVRSYGSMISLPPVSNLFSKARSRTPKIISGSVDEEILK